MAETPIPDGVEAEAADSVRLSSDVATVMALHEARKSFRGRKIANAFLSAQRRFVDLQASYVHEEREIARRAAHLKRVSDMLRILAQSAFIIVGVAVASGVIAMWWNAISSKSVLIDAFEAPPTLAANGLGGTVVAGKVLDGLLRMQSDTRFAAAQQSIKGAWSNTIQVKLPEAGISLAEISDALHRAFGHDVHIEGELTVTEGDNIALSIRGDEIPPTTFTGRRDEIDSLARQAAEHVYSHAQPALYAGYLIASGRTTDCLNFIRVAFPRTRDADRAVLASLWGEAFFNLNQTVEAESRYRFALKLSPHYWRAWNNLVGLLPHTKGEEAAYQLGQKMRKESSALLSRPRPTLYDQTNFAQLTLDPAATIAGLLADRHLAQREGAEYDASSWIAEQEAVRHDWTAVKMYLAESPAADVTTGFDVQYLGGLEELELGHYAAALDMFDAAEKLWQASAQLQAFFPDVECNIGSAYLAAGRVHEALPLFHDQRFVRCRAFQADALDLAGQWNEAERAYSAAEAVAPSMSFAYYREGLARLRHSDFAVGVRQLQVAQRLSPRWAEPLKALGDAQATQGRWKDALDYYKRALPLAPAWTALQNARNEAVAKVAH